MKFAVKCRANWKQRMSTSKSKFLPFTWALQLQPTDLEKVQLCLRFASHISQAHYSSESSLQVFADKLATSVQTTGDQPNCSQPKQCQASFQYRYLLLAIFMQLLIHQLQNASFSLTIGGFQSITNWTLIIWDWSLRHSSQTVLISAYFNSNSIQTQTQLNFN